MAKVGDIATYINGFAFKPSDWSDSGLPIIRIQDLTGNSYQANRYNGSYDTKYEVLDGDILISWSASLGVFVWKGEKALLNQHIFKVVFDKLDVDKSFFVYQMTDILENAATSAHGATMKHLTKPVFDNLEFYLPDIQIQKEIAMTLDRVTSLIALRQKQLEKLDELVKSRFVEMFGEPETNPKGWQRQRFDELCEILDSRRIPITSADRKAGIYPYYGASGIVDYVEDYIFDEELLLISEDGANLVMRTTPIAFSISGKTWVNNHAHVARFGSRATQKYIEVCFALIDISGSITGTAQPKLNQAKLNAMLFCMPPIELQEQFAAFVAQTDKSKLAVQKSLEQLETLKKSFMQKYFG